MGPRIVSSDIKIATPTVPVHRFLINRLQLYNDKTYLTEYETGNKFTYSQLLHDSLKLGSVLRKLSWRPGEVFMLYGFNCYEYLVAMLAGMFVGGIALPVRGSDTFFEVEREINSRDVMHMFVGSELREIASQVKQNVKQVKDVILFDVLEKDAEFLSVRSVLDGDAKELSDEEIFDPKGDRNTIALLLESSGTVGAAKATMVGHYDLTMPISIENRISENNNDKVLVISPVAHLSGILLFLFGMSFGNEVVSLRHISFDIVADAIEKHKITRCVLSPTMMNSLNKMTRSVDLSSLRCLVTGGCRLPNGVADIFLEKFKIKEFINAYTMTEITIPTTIAINFKGKYDAIGKVCAGIQIKVIDLETGQLLGENQTGEICVKGALKFKGYYKNPEATKALIDEDGWLHTGDVGYFDEDEIFFVIDRIKDIIKQSGFGFSPVDVEEVLLKHDAVEETAVVGIPDETEGEIAHAFVVLKERYRNIIGKQELMDAVNGQLTPLKRLKGEIHWVNELPKTSFGKIIRRRIRSDFLNANIQ